MLISEVMTRDPVALYPGDRLKKAIKVLSEKRISGCPVIGRDRKIQGIITQTDILRLIDVHSKIQRPGNDLFSLVLAVIKSERYDNLKGTIKKVLNLEIREFMKKEVITIDAGDDLYKAARLMNSHDIHELPVTEYERLVGIITRWDIIRALEKLG